MNSEGSPIVVVAPLSTMSCTTVKFGRTSLTSQRSSLVSDSEDENSKGFSSISAELASTSETLSLLQDLPWSQLDGHFCT